MSTLTARISLDSSAFSTGLDKVRSAIGGLSSYAASVLSLGSVIAFTKSAASSALEINDVAKRLGISTDLAQQLRYAAEQMDGDFQSVAKASGVLLKNLGDASPEMHKALAQLGINGEMIKRQDIGEILLQISKAMEDSGGSALTLNSSTKVLGKGAQELWAILREGPEAIQKAFADAPLLTEAQIKNVDTFTDRVKALGREIDVVVGKAINGGMLLKEHIAGAGWNVTIDSLFTPNTLTAEQKKLMDSINAKHFGWDAKPKMPPLDLAGAEAEEKRQTDLTAERERLAAKLNQNFLAGLSTEDRITALEKERLELAKKITAETDEQVRLKLQLKDADLAGQIGALERRDSGTSLATGNKGFGPGPSLDFDRLQRIGGFTGSSNQTGIMDATREVARNTAAMLSALVTGGIKIKDFKPQPVVN